MNAYRLLSLTFLLLASENLLGAEGLDPWLTLYDGGDGVTCEFFNVGARIRWKNRGGDWIDASGKPQGAAPYAEAFVDSIERPQAIEWDVTKLVQGWAPGTYPNSGLMLAQVPGRRNGDTAVFLSRETKAPEAQPQLALTFADGKESRLVASADSELNCSTVRSLGDNPTLKASGASRSVLQFDLRGLEKTPIKHATLRLTADAHQYGANTIGVYRLDAPLHPVAGKPEMGLAAAYIGDQGIGKDRDVVFATGFESALWQTDWSHISMSSNAERVASDTALRFEPLQGYALRVTIPKGGNQGLDMGYNFAGKIGTEPEEIYFRYYLRFANDWDPGGDGGKLPGPAGTYGKAGWGGRKADPNEGWSMRGGFRPSLSAGNPFHGRIPINTYAYHAGGEDFWGDPWDWMIGGLGILDRNRWYCIEQYFRVNTLGKSDGVMRAWVDGRLAYERTNVRVRDIASIKIEQIWMNVYYGGTAPAPRDLHLFIDNVVIAKRYIGPMAVR